MREQRDKSRLDEIRAVLRETGSWPPDFGPPNRPELLDLYDALEAPYRAAGRPFGDSLAGLVRWWRESEMPMK